MAWIDDLPDGLEVTLDGAVRVVTLNRPDDRNASTTEMLFAFADLFDALGFDDEAGVVILTGAGSAFSAGADFNFFVRSLHDPDFAHGISFAWPLYTSLLRAKELIVVGDRITPERAVEYGLATRVVTHDALMDEARALAEKLLEQPRNALRETKKILNMHLRDSAARVLDVILQAQFQATLGEEHQTRARAFLDNQRRRDTGA